LKIFQHERFYPMDIPQMFDKSPTLVRVKIWAAMEKGEIGTLVNSDGSKTMGPAGMYLLVDLTLIGYQGDKDLSIETFKVHEATVNKFRGTNLTKTLDKNGDLYWKEAGKYKSKDVEKNGALTVTIAVFRADQRISAITFSDSGKLYVASDGKVVKAFGVGSLLGFASRQAYLIKDGNVIWRDKKASTSQQAADVLRVLKEMK
jgi:hypothetical protein